jgi:hypothetical protein
MSGFSNIYEDKIGRSYCDAHRREECNECCLCFDIQNRICEEEAGLRKAPSPIEKLCNVRMTIQRGIDFIVMQKNPSMQENLNWHREELKRVEKELATLKRQGDKEHVKKATEKADGERVTQDAEMSAMNRAVATAAMASGQSHVPGPEMQRIYDQYVAPPPSAERAKVAGDSRTCSYCQKSSAEKLNQCARCKKQYYCTKECQKKHWKAHKADCQAVKELTKEENKRLPLTWDQLKEFDGVAEGRKLEVRFLDRVPGQRLIALCKDRAGVAKRIEAYTTSMNIPDFEFGKVLVWKHPRFHKETDGARIFEEDLANIKIQ